MAARRSVKTGLAFNHAMIYTQNVERALEFYGDRLGFRLLQTFEHGGRKVYARLKSPKGTTTIALHLLGEDVHTAEAPGIRLYFETPRLDALCKTLRAAGVKFKQMPRLMPWGWKHAYLDDPDGHEVSLYWAGKKRLQKN